MPKTILKTFRLPFQMVKEIEKEAKKQHVSQTQYMITIFSESKYLKLKKGFEEDLKKMEKDTEYQKEQYELAEANFL